MQLKRLFTFWPWTKCIRWLDDRRSAEGILSFPYVGSGRVASGRVASGHVASGRVASGRVASRRNESSVAILIVVIFDTRLLRIRQWSVIAFTNVGPILPFNSLHGQVDRIITSFVAQRTYRTCDPETCLRIIVFPERESISKHTYADRTADYQRFKRNNLSEEFLRIALSVRSCRFSFFFLNSILRFSLRSGDLSSFLVRFSRY